MFSTTSVGSVDATFVMTVHISPSAAGGGFDRCGIHQCESTGNVFAVMSVNQCLSHTVLSVDEVPALVSLSKSVDVEATLRSRFSHCREIGGRISLSKSDPG